MLGVIFELKDPENGRIQPGWAKPHPSRKGKVGSNALAVAQQV